MEKTDGGSVNPLPISLGSASFFFTSPWKSVITGGHFCSVTTPAADGDDLNGAFQQALHRAFAAARHAGIENPLLVGAVPFDTRQPSAFFIPRQRHFFNRQSWQQTIRQSDGQPPPDVLSQQATPEKAVFMAMVAKAVAATAKPGLDKVVLSRLMDITTAQPLQSASVLNRLITLNPESCHFYLPLTDGTTLLGASPELLLRKSGRRFSSMPLAGSSRRNLHCPEQDAQIAAQLMQSQKDRDEHQWVIQAMEQVLQPRSLSLAIPAEPTTIATSTLWHLATGIEGDVFSPDENALSMACLLHPTPALSGYPHAAACRLISQLEPFDRQLFGGMVGWCDDRGNGEWVVTIRCARLAGNRARLFAGAGIVPASSPEAEWHETDVKLSTMLKVFGLLHKQ